MRSTCRHKKPLLRFLGGLLALAGAAHAGTSFPMHDAPMAYVLRRGELEVSVFKEKINETIDIFDVKEGQTAGLPNTLDLGAIGDLDGWRIGVNFGLADRTQFGYVSKRQDIEFGSGTLKRNYDEFRLRHVIKRGDEGGTTLAIEPLFRSNRGSGISRDFTRVSAFGFILTPPEPIHLEFGGVKDETYGIRLLASRQVFDSGIVSAWAEYDRVEVGSELRTNIFVNEIQRIVNALEYGSTQWNLGLGGHLMFSDKLSGHLRYEHFIIDRDINDRINDVVDTNDVIRARLDYALAKSGWLSLQADYFSNQLAGEVPFVFNELSASRFDKVYGYLGLGLTFQIDYGD